MITIRSDKTLILSDDHSVYYLNIFLFHKLESPPEKKKKVEMWVKQKNTFPPNLINIVSMTGATEMFT